MLPPSKVSGMVILFSNCGLCGNEMSMIASLWVPSLSGSSETSATDRKTGRPLVSIRRKLSTIETQRGYAAGPNDTEELVGSAIFNGLPLNTRVRYIGGRLLPVDALLSSN